MLILCLLLLGVLLLQPAPADPPYPLITAENAAGLTEVATLGQGRITGLAWSADGRSLAAAGDRGVWVYDATTPGAEPRLYPTEAAVQVVAFSPDSAELAYITHDATLTRLDTQTGAMLESLTLSLGYGVFFETAALAYSPDGRWLAYGIQEIVLRERATGAERTLNCDRYLLSQLIFSPDSARLACFSASFSDYDGGAWVLFDPATGDRVRESGRMPSLAGGAFGPGERLYAFTQYVSEFYTLAGSGQAYPASLAAWDLASGQPQMYDQLAADGLAQAHDILFDASGRISAVYLADEAVDGRLIVRDLTTGAALFEQPAPPRQRWSRPPHLHALSPDGTRYAFYLSAAGLRVVTLATGAVATLSDGHTAAAAGLALSPDDRLAAVADEHFVHVWSLETGDYVRRIALKAGLRVHAIAFLPDGALAAADETGSVYLWPPGLASFSVFQPQGTAITKTAHLRPAYYNGLAWDGARLNTAACWEDDFTNRPGVLRDGLVRYLVWPICATNEYRRHITLNDDASALAYTTGPDGLDVRVLDRDGGLIADIPNADPYESLAALALNRTADRLTLAGGYTDHGGGAIFVYLTQWQFVAGAARVIPLLLDDFLTWDGAGEPLPTSAAPFGVPHALTYHPLDDALFAVGGGEIGNPPTVQVWHVPLGGDRGTLLAVLSSHTRSVRGVRFTSDGTRLVTAGRDGVLRVWAVAAP